MPITINKRIFVLLIVIFGIVAFLTSLAFNMYRPLPEEFLLEMKIKVIDKSSLQYLYTRGDISVVDCSLSDSDYKLGRRLPSSVWSIEPSMFKNTDRDIVVYSNDDEVSRLFCIQLLRIVNVDVYLFRFGYPAWIEGEE